MPELDTELIDKQKIEIEKVPQKELDKRDEFVPHFKNKIELSENQIERLRKEVFKHYDLLKDSPRRKEIEAQWDEQEAQYKGEMADDTWLEFNLDVGITMVKVDSCDRLILKALIESDPKFTVSPRPQMAKIDQWDEVVNRQAEYLDYKLDEEIDIVSPLRKVIHQATKLKGGIMKIPYEYRRKKRRREETFSGKIEVDDKGQPRQRGLEAFIKQYPDAQQEGNSGHWAFKDLVAGKDVTFKAEYNEVVYNDPKPSFVSCRDFFVDLDTEGYQGLCDARVIIERQKYSWWELKKKEADDDFENVDECKNKYNDKGEGPQEEIIDYEHAKHEILECTYHFNLDNDSSEEFPEDALDMEKEVKIVCWFHVLSKAFLGAILYPWDGVDSHYIPFYIKDKEPGFFKGGMAEDIKNDALIQNAMINFMLTECWQQLMTTPIVPEGSPVAEQFINKRWKPGVPLEVPAGTLNAKDYLGFLDKPQKMVAAQLINVVLFLGKLTDDKTGISSLATGKESPTDPTAPAAKTAMLLKQSGINISDYINCIVPSFNICGEIILALTYQMSQGGRKYRQRMTAQKVAGGDPFAELSRDEMVAKTNIQSRAAAFDFDKINEKREMLAYWQIMRADPILSQNPSGVYALARTLTQAWSPLLKNKVDQLLPDPETFKTQQFQLCVKALGMYMDVLSKKKQVTGVEQQPNLQEFVQMAGQMMSQALTPPPEKK